ncbi:MAG: nucleotide sugar dehydrogenase [Prochlorococcus marinus CUG1438]|nr:nucleotide sugar dehydrogenase [Prochlorococcus marinus CUG1438]
MSNKKKLNHFPDKNKCTIAVIGLGYVGLPLAIELAKKKDCYITGDFLDRKIIGFDINQDRLEELKKGIDKTNEISNKVLSNIKFHDLTSDIFSLSTADVFIISVPTPINDLKEPDLDPLKKACLTVGKALKIKQRNLNKKEKKVLPIIIFESTVFPGTTEEICIPIIKKQLDLKIGSEENILDFAFGYSPERINPGDKKHTLVDIKKITSGNTLESSNWIKNLYGSIIKAGIYQANSIRVAEAAKIIENTQRDINIALVNEFAIIFKLMGIDTLDVIDAASSKWNFLPFKPGLVGGHCIGVDPYYLTYKAKLLGYCPEIVLAGRKINDNMGKWVTEQVILEIFRRGINIDKAEILILGITFKENCSDIRNTKVIDIIKNFQKYKTNLTVVDPLADCKEFMKTYGIKVSNEVPINIKYNVVICTVAHQEYLKLEKNDWEEIIDHNGFFFDLKGFLPRELDILRP